LQEDAEEKGREEGWKDGREEGRGEEKLAIARKALSKNMPVEDIMDLTGLSVIEIQSLRVH
jgi:predicted transposase/invertase (TIGR01784 family)